MEKLMTFEEWCEEQKCKEGYPNQIWHSQYNAYQTAWLNELTERVTGNAARKVLTAIAAFEKEMK